MTLHNACHANDNDHNNGSNIVLEAAQECSVLTSESEHNNPSLSPFATSDYSAQSENSSFTEPSPMKMVDSTQGHRPKSSERTCCNARASMSCPETIENLLWEQARYCRSSAIDTTKRKDYIAWDDYFMAIAILSAHRSKDPDNATGACIVDASNRVIGIGYSGFPAGADDDVLPWTNRTSSAWLHTKSPYLIPAPINAILNKCAADCSGARLYTPTFPCNECAKIIIQARIGEVIFLEKNVHDSDSIRASRILLSMANVRIRQHTPEKQELQLDFSKVFREQDLQRIPLASASSGEQNSCPQQALQKFRELLLKEANYDPLNEGSSKRKTSLSWDDYFMAMAFLTAQRSKDPNTQVGACIVDANKRIVGLGYNGFPMGCSDDDLPWARQADSELHKKYAYVVHAEVNAILNKGSADLRGSTLFVALFPCNECAKVIIQAGIQEVVYMADQYHDTDSCRASRILLEMARIRVRKHIPKEMSISIRIDENGAAM